MTVIDVRTEPDRLDAAARADLSERLTTSVLDVEVGDDNALARSGIMVTYTETPTDRWAVGGRHDDSHVGDGGRILLDVSVMAADWTAERRRSLLQRLAADVAAVLGLGPGDLTTLWILLRVVPDGSWGFNGDVISAADIVGVFGEPHASEVGARLAGDGPH